MMNKDDEKNLIAAFGEMTKEVRDMNLTLTSQLSAQNQQLEQLTKNDVTLFDLHNNKVMPKIGDLENAHSESVGAQKYFNRIMTVVIVVAAVATFVWTVTRPGPIVEAAEPVEKIEANP